MYFALCVLLFGDDRTHKCTKYDARNIEQRLAIDAPKQRAKNSFGQHLVARQNLDSQHANEIVDANDKKIVANEKLPQIGKDSLQKTKNHCIK